MDRKKKTVNKHAKEKYKERQRAIRQRHLQEMKYKKSMKFITLIVFLLCVVLSLSAIRLLRKNAGYEEQISALQKQIDEETKYAESLNDFEEYVQTDEYIEDVAREKLGLIYPNEIIFKPR